MVCSEKTVDRTPGELFCSEVATLGWMVSLRKSVSHTCCGPAVQSAGEVETPWFFASMGFAKRLAVTVSHVQWKRPFIAFASRIPRGGTVSKAHWSS